MCSFYLKVQMWELTVVLVVEVVGNARTNKLCSIARQSLSCITGNTAMFLWLKTHSQIKHGDKIWSLLCIWLLE